jgi:hypothetical protein
MWHSPGIRCSKLLVLELINQCNRPYYGIRPLGSWWVINVIMRGSWHRPLRILMREYI